jgi:hypothetical protein
MKETEINFELMGEKKKETRVNTVKRKREARTKHTMTERVQYVL